MKRVTAVAVALLVLVAAVSAANHPPRKHHNRHEYRGHRRAHHVTDKDRAELAHEILDHHAELRREEKRNPSRFRDVDEASSVPTNGRAQTHRHTEFESAPAAGVKRHEMPPAPTNGLSEERSHSRSRSRKDKDNKGWADVPGSAELANDADKALKLDINRKLGIKGVAGAVNKELRKDAHLVKEMAVEDAVRSALRSNHQDDARLDSDLNRDASKLHADLENTIVQAEEHRGASWKKIAQIGTALDKGWKNVKKDVSRLRAGKRPLRRNRGYGDNPDAEGEGQPGVEGGGPPPGVEGGGPPPGVEGGGPPEALEGEAEAEGAAGGPPMSGPPGGGPPPDMQAQMDEVSDSAGNPNGPVAPEDGAMDEQDDGSMPNAGPNDGPPHGGPNDGPPQGGPNDGPPQGGPNDGAPQGGPNDGPPQGGPNDGPPQGGPNDGPPQGQAGPAGNGPPSDDGPAGNGGPTYNSPNDVPPPPGGSADDNNAPPMDDGVSGGGPEAEGEAEGEAQ